MYIVAAFYKFAHLSDFEKYRPVIAQTGCSNGVCGSILLAEEGVNGTIAGSREGINAVLLAIKKLPGCADLEHKESTAQEKPFKRFKVRLKKEIVTMGTSVDAVGDVGTYVDPSDWNELISDPNVILVDARNRYEVSIGSFEGAIDPKTENFRQLPAWLDALAEKHSQSGGNVNDAETNGKKLAMFCTGGIRCEKATAYAKSLGFGEVLHLKGGILKYLETIPEAHSKWQGACFVFDDRVSVEHGLEEGGHVSCGACGFPVSKKDQSSEHYIEGVQCPACVGTYSPEQRARFAERQKQVELAESRGQEHLGTNHQSAVAHREKKRVKRRDGFGLSAFADFKLD